MSRPLHLYSLSRMLAEPAHSFRVSDDLEVFDRSGTLVEVVYVETPDFLARARQRLKEQPKATQRFVSFAPVPRVLEAIPAATGGLDGEARATLERAGFSRKQIDALREVFVTEEVEVREEEGFAHLSAWLSREQRRVSAVDVRERMKVIAEVAGLDEIAAARRLAAIGVPVQLRVEVTPRELGWMELVETLRSIPGARVHVTVDEAYWGRAQASGATLLWDNVTTEFRERKPNVADEGEWEAYVIEGGDVASLQPKTWTGAAGVLRGLLWRDVQHYMTEHAELIDDVMSATRAPALAWAVLDPAGLQLLNVEETFPQLAVRRPKEAFPEARAWLEAQTRDWAAPATDSDWRGFAEVGFWAKRWGISPAIMSREAAHDGSKLETLADVVFATGELREETLARLRKETLTASITDTGEGVTAHWIAPVDRDVDLQHETVRRLDLLRRLYADRQAFGAHVYGNVSAELKRDVPAEQFPVPWLLRLHLMFVRPELTWDEYVAEVISVRSRIAALAARITAALTTWFRRDKPFTIFEAGVDAEEWDAISAALSSLPRLPRTAVDEWGIEIEGAARAWSAGTPHFHVPYENALNAYVSAIHDFLAQSWRFFVANPQIGRGSPEAREKLEKWLAEEGITREVPTERLAQALEALKAFQKEFRARFPTAPAIEQEERERLWELWAVWWDFAFYPRRKLANAVKESKAAIDARLDERRRALRRRFRELTLSNVDIHAEHEGLWITLDVQHVPNVVNAFAEALAHVIDVLRPPAEQHAFDRYVLDLVWERVHLVPLVRGKSLERKRWSLDIATLPRPDENLQDHAWKFVQRPIDHATWNVLGLDEWPSNVAPVARRLVPAVAAWRDALDHLAALRGIPEADPDVLIPHWRDVVTVATRRAEDVQELLAQIPRQFFAAHDDAVDTLQEFARGIRAMVADAEPLAFDTAETARAAVAETLVQAAAAIGEVWTDSELP
ncbi:MAG TPA: hypothetical protein VE974_16505 [Thermoanaerobaculia bacterium]|nr:hypothetical protein [Thermoanaerobaculia bacterium]